MQDMFNLNYSIIIALDLSLELTSQSEFLNTPNVLALTAAFFTVYARCMKVVLSLDNLLPPAQCYL